jgi:hypothetical protein
MKVMTKEEIDRAINAIPLDLLEDNNLPSLPEEDIKQIASDLFHSKIFTSEHLKTEMHLINQIFSILLFLEKNKIPKNLGMIWEYLSKAGPMSVNGYPMFLSCHFLNMEDTIKVFALYNKLKTLEEETLKSN